MAGGTLIVSRAKPLFPFYQQYLPGLGFKDVEATGEEKDSLNMVINELKPRLMLVESNFYHAGTPYMMGQILKRFPKLNIAAVSLGEYPAILGAWFYFHGVKSYVNFREGVEEFLKGLAIVRQGGAYISPRVQKLIDQFPEWPDTEGEDTKRLMEVLIMLCGGISQNDIGASLQISRNTVGYHLKRLYKIFHVENREGMVALAWELGLVTREDVCFLKRDNELEPLPVWAAVKLGRKKNDPKNEKRRVPAGR
jgi:DNA-binding NarL/FixJ family response regulator